MEGEERRRGQGQYLQDRHTGNNPPQLYLDCQGAFDFRACLSYLSLLNRETTIHEDIEALATK